MTLSFMHVLVLGLASDRPGSFKITSLGSDSCRDGAKICSLSGPGPVSLKVLKGGWGLLQLTCLGLEMA